MQDIILINFRKNIKENEVQSVNLTWKDELKGFTFYKLIPPEYQTHGGYEQGWEYIQR